MLLPRGPPFPETPAFQPWNNSKHVLNVRLLKRRI